MSSIPKLHSTIEMTMRYAHLAPHVARDAVMALQQSATARKQHMEARACPQIRRSETDQRCKFSRSHL